jgi:hypothetical protein
MADPDAIIGAVIPVAMGALHCSLGPVNVASLWRTENPPARVWRVQRPGVPRVWVTTGLPDSHSGKF